MKSNWIRGLVGCVVLGSVAVAATAPNWIVELLVVRAPQTELVRDTLSSDQFYLCWQGRKGQRSGVRFSAQKFQDGIGTMSPGERKRLSAVITPPSAGWTQHDAEVCFGP